jgi:hypothetical protein
MSSSVTLTGAEPLPCAPGLFDSAAAGAAGRGGGREPGRLPASVRRSGPRDAGQARGTAERHQLRLSTHRDVRALPPVPQAAKDLLADASRGLGRAIRAAEAGDRYAAAHLAALRAAAAVLAARARPVRGRRGSAGELIARVAPEFSEWAAFFAAGSAKRQAAEAGLHRLVTPREADDMVRQVATFVDLVDEFLSRGGGSSAAR